MEYRGNCNIGDRSITLFPNISCQVADINPYYIMICIIDGYRPQFKTLSPGIVSKFKIENVGYEVSDVVFNNDNKIITFTTKRVYDEV